MMDKTDKYMHDYCWDITIEYHIIETSLKKNNNIFFQYLYIANKGNNKITELRTLLQRESQNS